MQDSDDEDIEGDIDQQIESMLAPKRIVKEIKAPIDGSSIPGLTLGQSSSTIFFLTLTRGFPFFLFVTGLQKVVIIRL